MDVRPLRVATLITRLEGGAGVLALRGATALDPDEFQVTIITGSGNHLLDQAAAAGLEVIVEPALRTPVDPRSDLRALRALAVLLGRGRFDVAHTHTAEAGALGRMAAHRASVPRIVHTYHGSRSMSFSHAVAAVPTSRSNAGWAVSQPLRCVSGPEWLSRPSGVL
jgi:Glycosyltransferase Family 4